MHISGQYEAGASSNCCQGQHQQQGQHDTSAEIIPATTISDLPQELLVIIMQHTSLRHRFSACSLVSSSWYAAASTATTNVSTQPTSAEWRKFEPWLKSCKASSYVTSFTMNRTTTSQHADSASIQPGSRLQLPSWPGPEDAGFDPVRIKLLPERLQKLELTYCELVEIRIKAGGIGWSSRPGPLHGMRQLSHLSIDMCYTDAVNVGCLGALSSLQHLSLTQMHVYSNRAPVYNPLLALSGPSNLRQHLTHLTLGNKVSTGNQPSMFSGLDSPQAASGHLALCKKVASHTALKELKPAGLPVTAAVLQGLSALQHLTWLLLDGTADADPSSSTSSLSDLANLTALQRMQLRKAGTLDPYTLSALHRLRYLEITDTPVNEGPQGTTAFLDTLLNLGHLSYLFWVQGEGHEWADDPEAYAALTASSMQELHVKLVGNPATSPGLIKHMFPGQRQDPCNIRVLSLCLEPDMCSCIAGACPALRELHIDFATPLHDCVQQLQALQALTELTKLSFSVLSAQRQAMAALVQLTQLEELSMAVLHPVLADDLQLLAALTRLTRLSWTSQLTTNPEWDSVLEDQASGGCAPDVWQQLLQGIEYRAWPSGTTYDMLGPGGVDPASAVVSDPEPGAEEAHAAALGEAAVVQEAAEWRRMLVHRWVELPAREMPGAFIRVYCVLYGFLLLLSKVPLSMMQWQINLAQWQINQLQDMCLQVGLPGAALCCAPLWAALWLMLKLQSMMQWQFDLLQDVLDAMHRAL